VQTVEFKRTRLLFERRLLRPELRAEGVVPVVCDLAHRLEQILELFVVEAGKAPQRAHHDLIAIGVDGERRVGGSQERELEQAPVKCLAADDGHRHHRGDEEKHPVVFEDVDPDGRGALSNERVAARVEGFQLRAGALSEAREVGVDHGARVEKRLRASAIRVDRL